MTGELATDAPRPEGVTLIGRWDAADLDGGRVPDRSGAGHDLVTEGAVAPTDGPDGLGAVQLDGTGAALATEAPVIVTDAGYSVAVWVRLDTDRLGPGRSIPDGWYAVTALAQQGPAVGASTHCAFYVGARLLETAGPDGTTTSALHWCLNIAPVDGTVEQRDFEWAKAFSSRPIAEADFDRWVLLVGTVDVEASAARLHVRGAEPDEGSTPLPDGWPHWQADGSLAVGRSLWLGNPVDHWPGAIGPVAAFAGVLDADAVGALPPGLG